MADGLRFDGEKAGLWGRTRSGDRSEAANYMVVCPCGVDLGPLRRFTPRDGVRKARCGRCGGAVSIGPTGQILDLMTAAEVQILQDELDVEARTRLEAARARAALEVPDPDLIWTPDFPSSRRDDAAE